MLYLNPSGLLKLRFALAKGKTQHDKRSAIRERESNREMARALERARRN
jgi:SsrA-binding protein